MRVLSSHVEILDGVVLFSGEPLTGHLYQLAEDGFTVSAIKQLLAGKVLGQMDAGKRLCLDDDDPRTAFMVDGQPFGGTRCSFHDSGQLYAEVDYRDGQPAGGYREWHPNGVFREARSGDAVSAWSETGGVRQLSQTGVRCSFGNTGELRVLELETAEALASLERPLAAGSTLSLRGPGVTDLILCEVAELHIVSTLHLYSTEVSPAGLRAFGGLKEITTHDAGLTKSVIHSVHPHCLVLEQ